jgi:CheY-like chemotaxis protein
MMAGNTILIIEDDIIQREALAIELRQQGFTVITVEDGNEVLKRLYSGFLPNLILLDMLIPRGGCDGWWFLQQRQLTPELAAVPVLILTALSVASEAWATSLGATGLVRKPFDAETLLAEIRHHLVQTVQM